MYVYRRYTSAQGVGRQDRDDDANNREYREKERDEAEHEGGNERDKHFVSVLSVGCVRA